MTTAKSPDLELAYARARASRERWAAMHRYWEAETDDQRGIAEQDVRIAEANLARLPPLISQAAIAMLASKWGRDDDG